jgi:hypothetical protein
VPDRTAEVPDSRSAEVSDTTAEVPNYTWHTDRHQTVTSPRAPQGACSPSANAPARKRKLSPEISARGMELALALRERIVGNNPGAKPISETQLVAWAHEADLMLCIDKRSWEDVGSLIEWCQDDLFWRANILSMKKLREKFDQLTLNRKREGERKNSSAKQQESFAERNIRRAQEEIGEVRRRARAVFSEVGGDLPEPSGEGNHPRRLS